MPDSGPHNSVPGGICPVHVQCGEHAGWFKTQREVILTHEDGSTHRYAMARCDFRGGHDVFDYIKKVAP